jgi:anti-sigma factor RsiW
MAVLAVQAITRAGLNPATVAASAGGDAFPNSGRVFLRVVNDHATVARTVTVASQIPAGAIPQGSAKADLGVQVPALGERWIGPLDPASFNDANGRAVVTYDTEADLSVGAFRLA